ncbi:MAG: DegT/DnrJ/EryC1/StrS family aminotransferase, partial [Elusimicrobiota bacterium]
MIPFFGAGREFKAYGPKAMALARGVLSGGRWLQSEHVSRFEARLAAFTGRRFGVAVNSCTDALYFALVAAGVKPGDEVL